MIKKEMTKRELKQWLSNYNNNFGEDEAAHEFIKLQIETRVGKSALRVFDDLVYCYKGKYFLPHGKYDEFVTTFSK